MLSSSAAGSAGSSASIASSSDAGRAWSSGWQLLSPALPQQRSFASSGSNPCSGSSSSSVTDAAAVFGEPSQLVLSRRGRGAAVGPDLEAQLAALAQQCDCSPAALSRAVAAEGKPRQAGVVQYGAAVAAWLRSQGISDAQLQRLLLRCPVLFSRPVEQRAGMLLGQLQGLGLSAAEAARCFESQPVAAGSTSFAPAIGVLAELFAAGSKGSGPAEQLVGSFLRVQPSAVGLLVHRTEALREGIDSLLGLGLNEAQLVAAARQTWALLSVSPARLAALAGVLQQELGGGRELLAKLLRLAPRGATSSQETVRARAQALVFGQQATLELVGNTPKLLAVHSSVWQTALVVMQLSGMSEKQAMEVASKNAQAVYHNWLAVGPLANRLALQRCLQLTAGQVYMRHAGYVACSSAKRLAGRLLFLKQHGLHNLLGAEKVELLQQWRRQHSFRADRPAAGEPPLVSLRNICILNDSQFAGLPAVQAAGGLPALQAFTAGLQSKPAWVELQAAAAAEGGQLSVQLPPWLQRQWWARPGARRQRGRMAVV
ncbi:hypothetical protein ABPG77_009857 [Micractinium sp. CCAP 211/92]